MHSHDRCGPFLVFALAIVVLIGQQEVAAAAVAALTAEAGASRALLVVRPMSSSQVCLKFLQLEDQRAMGPVAVSEQVATWAVHC